jgi:acetyl-CoA/propionyl-CoA carboxylase biotin carboxyl carrier protein
MFRSVLIANRGEIAVRIIAAARAQGLRTIAIFSEADAGALHVRLADAAVCVGPASAGRSYLNGVAIVAAALGAGADAVHPGYGFLSENAGFARAVTEAGLTFVGPDPQAIETMSDKVAARAAAIAAGVPVLPGSDGAVDDVAEAGRIAARIGYPVAVKASFGGGGRGIRIAADSDGLEAAMAAAAREAGAAFGRSEIFLESFLSRPRHVEVQILADRRGTVVHLGDRDCTVQRRHQKMIEEAPAPDLPPELRRMMHDAAIALARAVGYVGAGTVEFLYDPATARLALLEMNTRLQVEHGVTELVTGIDLVEAQLKIAAGEPLGLAQDGVRIAGHAMQARISAEDCSDDFRPTPGRLADLRLPVMPWIRADFGVERGDAVQPHYDSMIGKLLSWGPQRDGVRVRLREALRGLKVAGVPTTAAFAGAILDEPDFVAVRHHTGSVERDWSIAVPEPEEVAPAANEENDEVVIVSERRVRLAGAANRVVAVFGAGGRSVPRAMPSRRADRASTAAGAAAGTGEGSVTAPMDGVVVRTAVAPGDHVEAGAPVLILEAMKMEVTVPSPRAGTVRSVGCGAGDSVAKGQVLIEIAAG